MVCRGVQWCRKEGEHHQAAPKRRITAASVARKRKERLVQERDGQKRREAGERWSDRAVGVSTQAARDSAMVQKWAEKGEPLLDGGQGEQARSKRMGQRARRRRKRGAVEVGPTDVMEQPVDGAGVGAAGGAGGTNGEVETSLSGKTPEPVGPRGTEGTRSVELSRDRGPGGALTGPGAQDAVATGQADWSPVDMDRGGGREGVMDSSMEGDESPGAHGGESKVDMVAGGGTVVMDACPSDMVVSSEIGRVMDSKPQVDMVAKRWDERVMDAGLAAETPVDMVTRRGSGGAMGAGDSTADMVAGGGTVVMDACPSTTTTGDMVEGCEKRPGMHCKPPQEQ